MEAALRQLQQKKPFRPIVVTIVDGEQITIRHPEQYLVDAETLYVLIPPDRHARWVSQLQIKDVQLINEQSEE